MQNRVEYLWLKNKGRVLYAVEPIGPRELICCVPAVEIDAALREAIKDSELGRLSFARRDVYDVAADAAAGGFLVVGPPSFCSHSSRPNAVVEFWEDGDGFQCFLYASAFIGRGAEITIAYIDLKSGRYPDHPQWQR